MKKFLILIALALPLIAQASNVNPIDVAVSNVAVMVDSELYPNFTTDINNYVADVEANFPVNLIIYTNNYRNMTFEQVRAELKGIWQNENIVGVIQVGFFPTLLFNMHGICPQPIGYMDLDGAFTDENTNFDENRKPVDEVLGVPDGIYDRHYWNDNGLEIWCALIRPYQPTDTTTDYTSGVRQQLHDFFDKTHAYYNKQMVIPRRGLDYINEDWWRDGVPLEAIFNEVYGPTNTVAYYGGLNSGFNFMEELSSGFETTYLYCHSGHANHDFDRGPWRSVQNTQLTPENGRGSVMTSGFNCHGADYHGDPQNGCMGQHYVFGSDLGQAFRGSSISFATVGIIAQAEKLRDGQYLGQAYLEVINDFYGSLVSFSPALGDNQVFGQILFGNPFLTASSSINMSAPPASISGSVVGSNEVRLTAKKDGKIMGVYYSDAGSFTIDYLPAGNYHIMVETVAGALCSIENISLTSGQKLTDWDITLPNFGAQTNNWNYFHIPEHSEKVIPSDWNSPGADMSTWDGKGPCPIGFDTEAALRNGTGITPWYSDLYVRKDFTVSAVGQNQKVYVYLNTASLTSPRVPEVSVNGSAVTLEPISDRTVMSYWQYRGDITSLVTGGNDFITAKAYEHIDISAPVYSTDTFVDNDPPIPNPTSFTTIPYATGNDSITMVATLGMDLNGPIEYYFECTSGAGHDSGWQSLASYSDTELSRDTTYTYTVKMRDAIGNVGDASTPASATTYASLQFPYGGSARAIPGIIEAEHYDVGGEGIAYHDADTANWGGALRSDGVDLQNGGTGCIVGWGANGEWLEYTVDVTAGTYDITASFASMSTESLVIKLDDITLGTFVVPNTGSFNDQQTVTIPDVSLVGGSNLILRVELVTGGDSFNFDYFDFVGETEEDPGSEEESDPPSPNPATFAINPVATSSDRITMVSETGVDASGPMIEYYFTCTSGAGHDSGWQPSASYTDTALKSSTTYEYTVAMRDIWGNETAASAPASATTEFSDQAPYGGTARPIPGKIEAEDYDEGGEMDAYHDTTVGNVRNIYRFDDVDIESCSDSGGGYDIGYIKDGEWLEYTVNVSTGVYNISGRFATYSSDRKLRFLLNGTELCILAVPQTGGWSSWQTVTATNVYIPGGTDMILRLEVIGGDYNFNWIEFNTSDIDLDTPPSPNPMTWVSKPNKDSDTAITMVSTTASHAAGVEYYFEETSGNPGGDDSGWQSGTTYTDSDLEAGYSYSYCVKARSLGATQSENEWSELASYTLTEVTSGKGVINVDFQNVGQVTMNGQGAYADLGNDYWNAYEEGDAIVSLLDSDGTTDSGLTLEVTGTYGSFDYYAQNNNMLLADYFYIQNTNEAAISIVGLAADQDCQMYVYMGGDNLDQLGKITMNGITVEQTTSNTGSEYVLNENYFIMDVVADASGEILGTFETASGTGFAAIKGLQIIAVPEPAMLGLLGLVLVGFIRRKK